MHHINKDVNIYKFAFWNNLYSTTILYIQYKKFSFSSDNILPINARITSNISSLKAKGYKCSFGRSFTHALESLISSKTYNAKSGRFPYMSSSSSMFTLLRGGRWAVCSGGKPLQKHSSRVNNLHTNTPHSIRQVQWLYQTHTNLFLAGEDPEISKGEGVEENFWEKMYMIHGIKCDIYAIHKELIQYSTQFLFSLLFFCFF